MPIDFHMPQVHNPENLAVANTAAKQHIPSSQQFFCKGNGGMHEHPCNGRCGGVVCWNQGTQPARRGKRREVGVRQWRRIDIAGCVKTQEAGSSQHQATFMHRVSVVVHCIIVVTSENHNRNRVLLYYLFQENKSFGSKTPFAFILWCTGSCVEHNPIRV